MRLLNQMFKKPLRGVNFLSRDNVVSYLNSLWLKVSPRFSFSTIRFELTYFSFALRPNTAGIFGNDYSGSHFFRVGLINHIKPFIWPKLGNPKGLLGYRFEKVFVAVFMFLAAVFTKESKVGARQYIRRNVMIHTNPPVVRVVSATASGGGGGGKPSPPNVEMA